MLDLWASSAEAQADAWRTLGRNVAAFYGLTLVVSLAWSAVLSVRPIPKLKSFEKLVSSSVSWCHSVTVTSMVLTVLLTEDLPIDTCSFSSTATSVSLVSAAYAVWHMAVAIRHYDDLGIAYIFHGIALFGGTFASAYAGRHQHMMVSLLLQESSSVFLNIRKICVNMGCFDNFVFRACTYGFATAFVLVRIVWGTPRLWYHFQLVWAELQGGLVESWGTRPIGCLSAEAVAVDVILNPLQYCINLYFAYLIAMQMGSKTKGTREQSSRVKTD